jgi:hypothetical protein
MINGSFWERRRSRTLLGGEAGDPENVDSFGLGSRKVLFCKST